MSDRDANRSRPHSAAPLTETESSVPVAELWELYNSKSLEARAKRKAAKENGDDEGAWIALGELFALDYIGTLLLAREAPPAPATGDSTIAPVVELSPKLPSVRLSNGGTAP